MACLDDNTILSFIEGTLPPERAALAQHHFDQCPGCRRLLSSIAMTLEAGGESGTADNLTTEIAPRDPGHAQEDAPWMGMQPGTTVDHYRVVEPIGQGGMARVYLAQDTRLGRKVALKVIHPRFFKSKEIAERFLFEARATARFNHPNIIAIYGVGEHDGQPYVALEYLEGQTLRRQLKEGPLPLPHVLRIGRAIAEALREAHRHDILHRDLKPSNVFLPRDGRVRVLDFGLAKSLQVGPRPEPESFSSGTGPGASDGGMSVIAGVGRLGTPSHMSPEQWRGEAVTRASDVWSLGVILFEMFAGRHPYAGVKLDVLAAAVAGRQPVDARDLERKAPPGLFKLITRCLAKDPAERPTAEEVARALAVEVPRRRRSSLSRQVWIVAASIALVGAAVVLWSLGRAPSRSADRGVDPSDVHATRPAALPAPDAVDARPQAGREDRTVRRREPGVEVRGKPRRRTSRPVTRVEEHGTLVVQSYHEGAPMWGNVYLEDRYRGQTPVTLRELAPGRHRLTVVRPGFAAQSRMVVIEAGKTARVSIGLVR